MPEEGAKEKGFSERAEGKYWEERVDYVKEVLNGKGQVFKAFLMARISEAGEQAGCWGGIYRELQIDLARTLNCEDSLKGTQGQEQHMQCFGCKQLKG